MPATRPAGPYPIKDVAMETWLVRFDENGACVSPATRDLLIERLKANPDREVIYFSHGWKTDFGGALEQYSDFLQAFEKVLRDHPLAAANLLFVGVTWPSRWLATNPGPRMAATADPAEAASAEGETGKVVGDIARHLDPDQAERLYFLTEAPSLGDAGARELAELGVAALKAQLNQNDPETASELPDPDAIVAGWKRLGALSAPLVPPDLAAVGSVGGGGGEPSAAGGGFDPLDFLRLFSIFQMKDRAATVGAGGIAKLLTALTAASKRGVHVVGHSFGAKVMLSAVLGDAGRAAKPKSLLLLQPALSHLAFAGALPDSAAKGGYHRVPDLVESPVLSTCSRWDQPLHDIFHLAVRRTSDVGDLKVGAQAAADSLGEPPNRYAALGGYGPHDHPRETPGLRIIELPPMGTPIATLPGDKVVGLDGSKGKRIDGHMGVANAFTGWALRQQIG